MQLNKEILRSHKKTVSTLSLFSLHKERHESNKMSHTHTRTNTCMLPDMTAITSTLQKTTRTVNEHVHRPSYTTQYNKQQKKGEGSKQM
jgi:hypothetical protein